jgi:hypothetical protein
MLNWVTSCAIVLRATSTDEISCDRGRLKPGADCVAAVSGRYGFGVCFFAVGDRSYGCLCLAAVAIAFVGAVSDRDGFGVFFAVGDRSYRYVSLR